MNEGLLSFFSQLVSNQILFQPFMNLLKDFFLARAVNFFLQRHIFYLVNFLSIIVLPIRGLSPEFSFYNRTRFLFSRCRCTGPIFCATQTGFSTFTERAILMCRFGLMTSFSASRGEVFYEPPCLAFCASLHSRELRCFFIFSSLPGFL